MDKYGYKHWSHQMLLSLQGKWCRVKFMSKGKELWLDALLYHIKFMRIEVRGKQRLMGEDEYVFHHNNTNTIINAQDILEIRKLQCWELEQKGITDGK